MAQCPSIRYGVPDSGATEFNVQSGRELLRCGYDCVQLYITNLTVEKSCVTFSCKSISDAIPEGGQLCLQSVQAQWRDQNVVNWIAKDNVTSDLPNGYVITRAQLCDGVTSIYTHTEGTLAIRMLVNSDNLEAVAQDDTIRTICLGKLGATSSPDGIEWILSDLSVNVSPTAWQGGSITYQGFGKRDSGSTATHRANFSWENGRIEESNGFLQYDVEGTPAALGSLVGAMLDDPLGKCAA